MYMDFEPSTYEGKARRDALILDRINPGWAEKIDQDILDVGAVGLPSDKGKLCVLCQLYGGYTEGLRIVGYEFDGPHSFFGATPDRTETWLKEIKNRLCPTA